VHVTIRAAATEDAPALGELMVSAWLSAHQGQLPDDAWSKRAAEWTPEVSARGWARVLEEQSEQSGRDQPSDVLLVAESDEGRLVGLVHTRGGDDDPGSTAEIRALYVAAHRQGQGVGSALLHSSAAELRRLGYSTARLEVLSANLAALGFYEHLGGRSVGQGWFDEDGLQLPVTYYEWTCEELSDKTARRGAPDGTDC
jgi:ribosomal protein S18 acetylase RimI-like enzyme